MKTAQFNRLVVALWGDHWQPPCLAFLAQHGHVFTRQTLWNWKKGRTQVPDDIAALFRAARDNKERRTGIATPVVCYLNVHNGLP
jgi:hypothetical protein